MQGGKPSNDATLSDQIAPIPIPPRQPRRNQRKPAAATASSKTKADTRRFTAEEAADYASKERGKPISPQTIKANAKSYGFKIKEKGTGLYALIDS